MPGPPLQVPHVGSGGPRIRHSVWVDTQVDPYRYPSSVVADLCVRHDAGQSQQ